jgi:predicted amidohydrolase
MSRKYNLEKAKKLIKQSKEKGAKLVILPSLFPIGNLFEIYDNEKKLRSIVRNLAEKIPGGITDLIMNLAMEGEVHIVSGPVIEQAGPKIFLTTLILSPQGEIIGKYRKIAVTERENRLGISSGKEPINIVLDKKYGLISEEDLFSPEINRLLTLSGSKIVMGTMKPYNKKQEIVKHFSIVRTLENEVPYIIGGEVVENEDGEIIGYSPTIVTSPDNLIYKEAFDEDSVVLVESSVLVKNNKDEIKSLQQLSTIISGLCRNYKKLKFSEKQNQEET